MATQLRKTPGVYITELSAFPPSVVGVDTAIPGFIGYTEFAQVSGKPWFLKPIRIRSMAEFETFFGGAYKPLYEIEEAKESPIAADDYDFMALEPTSTSPVTPPIPHYYRLTAARSPITPALEDEAFARVGAEDEPLEPLDFELARFNLYNSMRLFYANGGGDCYVVSVGDYAKTVTAADLVLGLNAMEAQSGPTMLVIPDLVLLAPNDPDQPWVPPSGYAAVVQQMLAQCGRKQDRVALIDVYGANKVPAGPDYETYFEDFYAAVGSDFLSYGIAYFPFLYTSVVQPQEINYQNIAAGKSFTTLQTVLDWQAQLLYTGTRLTAVQETIKSMEAYDPETYDKKTVDTTNQNLTALLPLLPQIETIILAENNVLPPSGAMAGVYTRVDAARGVWNAPANVSLNSVVQTTYQLTGDQQGDLNVPVNGKAIDALREFRGRGTVVWGARTLDGNSNDYRYIQVRRTLIYIEQSLKAALDPFVFAPNNGNTWTTVIAMCSAFLQGLWSQGGLMGATPAEAFTVDCGLGSTMTTQDILEGYMRVQVTLQMIRPAEFIELTFTQKMQAA